MASMDLLKAPIDHRSPDVTELLADLQGNILKSHGRGHSVHVFLRFRMDAAADARGKQWIRHFARERVTSAKRQLDQVEDFKRLQTHGRLFTNFFLSYQGYITLGLLPLNDPKFVAGMKASQVDLADPPANEWEEGYRDDIHAMIMLAHHDKKILDYEEAIICKEVEDFADIIAREEGKTLRNESCEVIEHFGYVDGRSQPLFLQEDIENEKKKDCDWQAGAYDPAAGPELILVRDPNGLGDLSFGSYLVFRKLEHNVRGFKEAEERLAAILELEGDDKERAGALVVGRFEDGTPVVLQENDGLTNPGPNNFDYGTDPNGDRCPLHAHIRKMNPRGETLDSQAPEGERQHQLENERRHRIARRGITYGERLKEPKDDPAIDELPAQGVGLLFMCFQSDIGNQFEFIQKQWANDTDPSRQKSGIDPVIGQTDGQTADQHWPPVWGSSDRKAFSFAQFVTLKGGEYFFAPSLSALMKIGE